jgi:Holliday junction resolvasome RuvABC endonuclease subunit
MKIAGIDYSANCPGVVVLDLNDDLSIAGKEFVSFTQKKKDIADNIFYYKKKDFDNVYQQYIWIRDKIISYVSDCEYVAFEDYAYAAKGKVFNIAETTAIMKLWLIENGKKLRRYDPNSIKMFATGNGNAGKELMIGAYEKLPEADRFDLSGLSTIKTKEDICDAYWCSQLLLLELKLRRGLVRLKDYPEKTIKIFNRVTKSYPENILVRNFIER